MPHNVVGKPVRGGDFFNRSREIVDMWSRLETDNILLLAPRRVGKTSLMYRLLDEAPQRQFLPTYVSVADAANELAFAKKLYEGSRTTSPLARRSPRSRRARSAACSRA